MSAPTIVRLEAAGVDVAVEAEPATDSLALTLSHGIGVVVCGSRHELRALLADIGSALADPAANHRESAR